MEVQEEQRNACQRIILNGKHTGKAQVDSMGMSMIHCRATTGGARMDLLLVGRGYYSHNGLIPGAHANFSVRVLLPVDG